MVAILSELRDVVNANSGRSWFLPQDSAVKPGNESIYIEN